MAVLIAVVLALSQDYAAAARVKMYAFTKLYCVTWSFGGLTTILFPSTVLKKKAMLMEKLHESFETLRLTFITWYNIFMAFILITYKYRIENSALKLRFTLPDVCA